jgi:hypothetical protein
LAFSPGNGFAASSVETGRKKARERTKREGIMVEEFWPGAGRCGNAR